MVEHTMDGGSIAWLRLVLGFALVLGLLALASWGLRRLPWFGSFRPGGKGTKRLAVVDSLVLDPRHRLVLVRQDESEHLLVIGAGAPLLVQAKLAGQQPATDDAAPPTPG